MDHVRDSDATDRQRLMHRWFVQYNPLYLISAMLCLAGVHMLVRALAARDSNLGELGAAAITELYAAALIAGAALLTRIGKRRAGVMLGLLAALYQGDLVLHTEACSCLGAIGLVAAVVWLLVFVAKLRALAWAVKVRPSRATYALVAYAGVGLALVPQLAARLAFGPRDALVGLWVFSAAALALHAPVRVESLVALDAWGDTVLRRSLRAVAALGAVLLALHVCFWAVSLRVDVLPLAPAAMLLATRWAGREARVWALVTATLVLVALVAPAHFATVALMAAATLVLRAHRSRQRVFPHRASEARAPFRASGSDASPAAVHTAWIFAAPAPAVRRRLLVGALFPAYLAAWTVAWSGGPWPAHVAWLDLALTAGVLFGVAKLRAHIALVPLAASYAHLLVQIRVITAPTSTLGWGTLCTGTAFALLMASLAVDYALRNVPTTPRVERDASAALEASATPPAEAAS